MPTAFINAIVISFADSFTGVKTNFHLMVYFYFRDLNMERLLFLTVSGKQKHPWQMWEPQTNICDEESVLFLTLGFTPLHEVLCLL